MALLMTQHSTPAADGAAIILLTERDKAKAASPMECRTMSTIKRFPGWCALLLMPLAVHAATANTAEGAPALSAADALKAILQKTREDTDSGVVVNQTMTVAGQDFYQYFMQAWREKEDSERHTLAVRERPSARWGSEVWIDYAQEQVFRGRLPSSRSVLQQLGNEAAEISYRNVLQANARREQKNDSAGDIGVDEF
jgi:curli production assembly/transport component CsgE